MPKIEEQKAKEQIISKTIEIESNEIQVTYQNKEYHIILNGVEIGSKESGKTPNQLKIKNLKSFLNSHMKDEGIIPIAEKDIEKIIDSLIERFELIGDKSKSLSDEEKKLHKEKGRLINLIRNHKSGLKNSHFLKILEHLENVFSFRKVSNPVSYYYKVDGKYRELNENTLQQIFFDYFGFKLEKKKAKYMLSWLSDISKKNKHLIAFDNGFILDTRTIDEYTRDDGPLVTRNINFEYDDTVDYQPNFSSDVTLTQKTLQEILIPKSDKSNHLHYIGFLERMGSCINYLNKHKKITIYWGKSDRGKNILSAFLRYILSETAYSTQAEALKERFELANMVGMSPLILEEVGGKSFLIIQSKVKAISGGDKLSCEIKGVQEPIKTDEFGKMFGFSNYLPEIDFEDHGMVKRLDIVELPNVFLSKKEYDNLKEEDKANAYIKNDNLKFELMDDKEGQNWLINACIKAYKDMVNAKTGYIDSLSDEETLIILNRGNPVQDFINAKVYKTDDSGDELYNSAICEALEEYLEEKNINNVTPHSLPMKVRKALNNRFGKGFMETCKIKSSTVKYGGFKLLSLNKSLR